jgi:predicted adenine nucleotide alpha hydrolase (AANH) superfamily ATPase
LQGIEQTGYEIQSDDTIVGFGNRELDIAKPKLLLHSCCAPCSSVAVERLVDVYDTYLFFYNPNITDEGEYIRRKNTQERFIVDFNEKQLSPNTVKYIEGIYEPNVFLDAVRGLEREPEGGRRCLVCFRLRLEKAAEMAVMKDCEYFTTTLSVSPHKDFDDIKKIGMDVGLRYKIKFLVLDFKKQGGYQRSVEISKMYDLYRQNYCGCRFSSIRLID